MKKCLNHPLSYPHLSLCHPRLAIFFFSSTCLSHMCFMFVLLTSNIQRSLYLAKYKILTAKPNYRKYPLLGCDIFCRNGSTTSRLLRSAAWYLGGQQYCIACVYADGNKEIH